MDFKRTLLVAALPFAFSLSSAAHALEIKFADIHPAGYPTVVAEEQLGKTLVTDSDGKLTFKMFAGGVLGSEKEVIEQAQVGAIQMARVSLGIVGPVVPDVNVFNMPFVFRDQAHMRKIIDGEIGQEILDKITHSEFNLVALAWMDGGTRNLYTKKPVRTLADLKGMKIRVQGNPMFIETINAMGGNGIAMDTGEIFSALQKQPADHARAQPLPERQVLQPDRASDPPRADRDVENHLGQTLPRAARPGEESRQGRPGARTHPLGREVGQQRGKTQGCRRRVHHRRQETFL
jgi:TRAP-type C4-dicarboxylate transport system substrate-binding protein